jgi:hypothetical protein
MPPPTATLELTSVAFFGRTFQEYLHFFGLARARLRGLKVLDVAAGPSSFTGEARSLGLKAVAADPLYGLPVSSLRTHVEIDYARMITQMRKRADSFRFRYFASINEAEASRREAAALFLKDYESGFAQGRYLGASLPDLPAEDGAYDLVLCAHLLFIYAKQFDYAWHLAAALELCRVSSGEVRIHPVCGIDGKPYEHLALLLSDLAAEGISGKVVEVDYEFFAGSSSTLVLTRGER